MLHDALAARCSSVDGNGDAAYDDAEGPPTRRLARRLPMALGPGAMLPGRDPAAFAGDVARRCGLTRRQREPVRRLALNACELVHELALPWRELTVDVLAGFLWQCDDMPAGRIGAALSAIDLLGDYLVCCGEIDEARRTTWIAHAQRVIDDIGRRAAGRGRGA